MHREVTRSDLADQVRRLEASRQQHIAALAQIDQLLSRIGDALRKLHVTGPQSARGEQELGIRLEHHAPAGEAGEVSARQGGRRRYRKAELTGEQAVIAFVRRQGSATTAEINRQWRIEGRGGAANNAILQLLRRGELVREPISGQRRGSRYRSGAPQGAAASAVAPQTGIDPSLPHSQFAGSNSGG
jgi:hypothetical protein